MTFPKMNRLSFILPFSMAVIIIFVAAVLSTLTFISGRTSAMQQAEERLQLLAESRAMALEDWSQAVDVSTRTLATSNGTVDALTEIQSIDVSLQSLEALRDFLASVSQSLPPSLIDISTASEGIKLGDMRARMTAAYDASQVG